MTPILFQIGSFALYTMWALVAVGFTIGCLLLFRLASKSRTKLKIIFNHLFLIFIVSIIGARLAAVALNWQMYFYEINFETLKTTLYIWDQNLSPWGAFIGIVISTIFIARKYGENVLSWLDRIVVAIISTTVFGNIGAYFEGLNYGNETSLPWSVIYESGKVKYSSPIHPTQIYAAIYSLILTIFLYQFLKTKFSARNGTTTFLGLILYSIGIFVEGFFRGDDTIMIGTLRIEQLISIITIIATTAFWIFTARKKLET